MGMAKTWDYDGVPRPGPRVFQRSGRRQREARRALSGGREKADLDLLFRHKHSDHMDHLKRYSQRRIDLAIGTKDRKPKHLSYMA